MELFVVDTNAACEGVILYLLVLTIDNKEVYKIGITNRKIEQRVCEILTSHFGIYRYFPYCKPKRFRKIENAYEKEQELLKYFEEYKYEPYNKFSGSTELISDIELDLVVDIFEQTYKGKEMINQQFEKCPVCGKDKKFVHYNEDGSETLTCGTKCEIKEKKKDKTDKS